MTAKSIMFQGTASDAGKSWVAAGLCRLLKQRGLSVAPFKSQNMALNSFITKDGFEMGRAQVFQAEAAGKTPDVRMNPILLKPSTDKDSQVIINGTVYGDMDAVSYQDFKPRLRDEVLKIYQSLASENDVVVLEGAGSPAEINLAQNDIVNMGMARMSNSPVILVADIDKGGVFASIYGTVKLLPEEDQKRIKGIIINKFRGDKTLLQSGNDMIEDLTGIPVIGVLPMSDVDLDEEDSVDLINKPTRRDPTKELDIAVLTLGKISNFTDFHSLSLQPDVSLRYVKKLADLAVPDVLIIPGSKNTNEDLRELRNEGFVDAIHLLHDQGTQIIGICGGYQILGKELLDPNQIESDIKSQPGLGLLDAVTTFNKTKTTTQAIAKRADTLLYGYEIHMGITKLGDQATPLTTIIKNNGESANHEDGAITADGTVWGTYLHGIFDNTVWTREVLDGIRHKKGLTSLNATSFSLTNYKEDQYDKLAKLIEDNVDLKALDQILSES
ncbi:cobyric acid synthase [Furfurilactobacillus siliginis]|uniref:Cobyric acid synthase n=1 Tax=Furfurilactobacillus siliginis TaxID=348151 RepID=A0A0R2L8U9_9LACO|nr:cobyric acid synthase [Furfurilactobacillus siliginis]KRN96198.1 cobyric acid synthase [Furfurilactobacillus siliginis]GEK27877.1 cobyric acid synthase [Furfurilactobacillus siliginis]